MNFKHSASRKKIRPWYESIFWGPLVIALTGALIAATVQVTGIILPIYFQPSSESDFNIMVDPGIDDIFIYDNEGSIDIKEKITVSDIYPWGLKPYRHPIQIKIIGPIPPGVIMHFQDKPIGHLKLEILMEVQVNNSTCKRGNHEILIQGIGENGLIRNCTYFLNLKDNTNIIQKNYSTYGDVSRLPVGVYSGPEYGTKLYVDANGTLLSREEFMLEHGIDPENYWRQREAGFP